VVSPTTEATGPVARLPPLPPALWHP